MKPKNNKIQIGNILSEHTFIGGTKYWRIDKAIFEENEFKVGTRVCWVDPDAKNHSEYNGNIEWLMIDEFGNVEVSIDNILVGRLNLEDLIKINLVV